MEAEHSGIVATTCPIVNRLCCWAANINVRICLSILLQHLPACHGADVDPVEQHTERHAPHLGSNLGSTEVVVQPGNDGLSGAVSGGIAAASMHACAGPDHVRWMEAARVDTCTLRPCRCRPRPNTPMPTSPRGLRNRSLPSRHAQHSPCQDPSCRPPAPRPPILSAIANSLNGQLQASSPPYLKALSHHQIFYPCLPSGATAATAAAAARGC